MRTDANPTYLPLVTACADYGISRSVAYELVAEGHLETFKIGARRYVLTESLRQLPQRMGLAADKRGGR